MERAVSDPSFPVLLALRLAKTNVLTVPTYLNRALPLRVSCVPLADFDLRVRNCLLSRLDLPVPLPAPAFTSLTQPGRNGGLGLRLRSSIAPAAKWASAAIVAPDLVDLAFRVPNLLCVVDRESCHVLLRTAGVRISDKPDKSKMANPAATVLCTRCRQTLPTSRLTIKVNLASAVFNGP